MHPRAKLNFRNTKSYRIIYQNTLFNGRRINREIQHDITFISPSHGYSTVIIWYESESP
jgi:hypothetical protein